MTVAHYDPTTDETCTHPGHTAGGRGPGRVQVDGQWLCIRDARRFHGVEAWATHILNGPRSTGIRWVEQPADLASYDGPETFQSLRTNMFGRNTTYDFVGQMWMDDLSIVYLSLRATGGDLRTSAFRATVAGAFEEMAVTLSKRELGQVQVFWRAV